MKLNKLNVPKQYRIYNSIQNFKSTFEFSN
jgi:hypothetical protein